MSELDTDHAAKWQLWLAGLGAPIAWSMHWLFGYALASIRCSSPNNTASARHLAIDPYFLLVSVAAVLLAAAGSAAAWRAWRRSESSEAHIARGLFLARGALLVSGLFALALLFSILNLVVAPLCG